MLRRTNVALGIGIALYFLPHVNNKLIFFPAVLISSIIPDLGSFIARHKTLFKRQRHITIFGKTLKNYLTPTLLAILLTFTYPVLALPFFLGYTFTLSLEAFTLEGIAPFWPISKKRTTGHLASGGSIDLTMFYIFVIFDVALLIKLFI